MLLDLHVRDLALVEEVWVELGPGLTVLTGETGAGKTVLVSALKLLLGERADSSLVRTGSPEALVEARFDWAGRESLVRRRVSAEGRSRCTIDGEMVTVAMLAETLGESVDLHGQHEHQALLAPANHAAYLDRFIGEAAVSARESYRSAWRDVRSLKSRIAETEALLADRERRLDYLAFQVAEIDTIAPVEGEDDRLQAELPRLRHGDRLTKAAAEAWSLLHGDGGACDGVGSALQSLATTRGLDPGLDALAQQAERLDVELGDLALQLRDYAESVEHDPAALDVLERRLQDLTDLRRKYGGTLVDVLRIRDDARREIAGLNESDGELVTLRAQLAVAEEELRRAAAGLTDARECAVTPFTGRLAEAVRDLALPGATFRVRREPRDFAAWGIDGPESVEFLFSAHAGEEPRPLQRIASGGELSRVMLALKGVLGEADTARVLVFDEVDAGIGGATGLAVGRRLASLARGRQVLVVTHLAQVAAFADAHVVVSKATSEDRTVTIVTPVTGEERVAEIARMLAGGDSGLGRAHARELLDMASTARRQEA